MKTHNFLLAASLTLLLSAVASAQAVRSVQVRSVDFDAGWVEIFNYGGTTVDLSGWRFCSFDEDDSFVYSSASGLNGQSINAGESIFIHFNDDAPVGDPGRINRSAVGAFALPLDASAWGLALFDPPAGGSVTFGDNTQIADYIQWNIGGAVNGNASTRASQAVAEGLWTGPADFISTNADTRRIDLTIVGDLTAQGPTDYTLVGPATFDEHQGVDASDDHLNPTALTFPLGSTRIVVVQQGDFEIGGRDIDYITFTVPSGEVMTGIQLDGFIADQNNQAFYGLQQGSFFTTDAGSTGLGDLFGG
ncbi:MAG: hypothetical protein AAGG01_21755, partial [Planctomycetota bacterium]